MKPAAVALDFGDSEGSPPRTSSDFEEISYPYRHQQVHQQAYPSSAREDTELPLHYMTEDTARRRVPRIPTVVDEKESPARPFDQYDDDEGKDVYNKLRPPVNRIGSGKLRYAPPPPPTTMVRMAGHRRHCHVAHHTVIL